MGRIRVGAGSQNGRSPRIGLSLLKASSMPVLSMLSRGQHPQSQPPRASPGAPGTGPGVPRPDLELPEPARSGRPRSPKPTISGLAAASSMGNLKIGGLYRGPRLLPPAAACGSRWRRGSSCTGSARISPVRGNGRGSKNSTGCINNQPRRPITSPIRAHFLLLGPTAKICKDT